MIKRCLLGICLLVLLLPFTMAAQDPMHYRDIPLGDSIKKTTSLLKKRGFKVVKSQVDHDDLFYGDHQEVFLLGEQDGYPAVIHLEASAKTKTVFTLDVILREFIDIDEALEHLPRLEADESIKAPSYERKQDQPGMGLVEIPDRKGRLTKYVTSPLLSFKYYFYESTEHNQDNYRGCAIITVRDMMMGHEHIIETHYYDAKAARLAESEGNGKWAGKLR